MATDIRIKYETRLKSSEIKARIKERSIEVLRAMGVREEYGRWYCPICQPVPENHTTPDLTVRDGNCKCWRCGFKDDVIGLYMKSRNVTFVQALEQLSNGEFQKAITQAKKIERPKKKNWYKELRDALIAVQGKNQIVAQWSYEDENNRTSLVVVRLETPNGKSYRPISKTDTGWIIGKEKRTYPLYRLTMINRSFDDTIFVVEGEKAADALIRIGLFATTSSGGANGMMTTDWSPLKSRRVIIWPDNDPAGACYAESVKKVLPNATIFMPEGMGPKEDAYDWVESGGTLEKLRELWKRRKP